MAEASIFKAKLMLT